MQDKVCSKLKLSTLSWHLALLEVLTKKADRVQRLKLLAY